MDQRVIFGIPDVLENQILRCYIFDCLFTCMHVVGVLIACWTTSLELPFGAIWTWIWVFNSVRGYGIIMALTFLIVRIEFLLLYSTFINCYIVCEIENHLECLSSCFVNKWVLELVFDDWLLLTSFRLCRKVITGQNQTK